jgi:hypothetical protein
VHISAGRVEMFADAGEVCRRGMSIDYPLFDVACDKGFGHFDWYHPVVHFRVVSFDWGYRGHDVDIGVRTEVCYAPQAIGFASCDV